MPQLQIADGFYTEDSLPLAAQRCINWEPVVPQGGALNQKALYSPYGILELALTGDVIRGVNRGAQTMAMVPYFVNGNSLYSVDSDFVVTRHGIIGGSGRTSMANNGRYLVVVVPGSLAYAYDRTTGVLAEITDPSFRPADTVVFKDGYFVFTASDGSVFFNSALNDPLTYDALDFGSAEINPDVIVCAHVNHNELFIGGEETIELFQNVGGVGFPFLRIPGANIQKGVHARFTTIEHDNTFLFAGGGKGELTAIWKVSSSSNAQKVSTSAIDNEIQKFTSDEIAAAFAYSYAYRGSYFAAFTFDSDRIPPRTFVYDATSSVLSESSVWHERQTGVDDNRWRVQSMLKAHGKLWVGDCEDGRIGVLDKDTYTDYGEPIFRQRASQPFHSEQLPLFAGEIRLTMEPGVGLVTGSDPQVRMDYSDDGSKSWSPEYHRSYGKLGEHHVLPAWRRQGRIPRHRVLRFTTAEPVKSNILRLDAEAEAGV